MTRKLAIVPAFNEEEAIFATVSEIQQKAPHFDVLVIDDGSADDTAGRAAAAGARVLRLPFNLGIGGAMQTGYIYALEHDYHVAVQVDGDGQHDPANITELLNHLETNTDIDMVTGSRFLVDDDGFRSSATRRAGITIFARLVTTITGQRVTDPTSGFRMTNRKAITLFARDYPHDYPEVEAIVLMHHHRLRSCEIPVKMRPRTTGVSTISAGKPIYYMIKVSLAIGMGLLRRRPVPMGDPAVPIEGVLR